jgi:Uma2 family endonuclease
MLTRSGVRRIPMTKAEFFERAEKGEEGLRDWEEGVAIQLGPAHGRHNLVLIRLGARLDDFLTANRLGRMFGDIFIDFGKKTYGADLAVLLGINVQQYRDGRVYGPPDIVVEVISPESVQRDRVDKFNAYLDFDVPWYWLIDPQGGIIEEYHHTSEGYTRTSVGTLAQSFQPRGLPGFATDVAPLMDESDLE